MRRIVLRPLLGWTAALLALTASEAAANQLSLASTTFRAAWSGMQLMSAIGTVRCQLTLEGSFHARTLAKVVGSLVGYVTRTALGPCSEGSATVLSETLPWHQRYRSFSGALPNIAGVTTTLVGFGVRTTSPFGSTCIYRATDTSPVLATANVSAGTIASLTLGGSIPTSSECFSATGTVTGTSTSATVLNSTTRNMVTLIAVPPPAPDPIVVSVGDSYISGEAGRWAGNTFTLASTAIDRFGPRAYFDEPRAEAEQIPLCHRSVRSAEILFGTPLPLGRNLACSGARVRTFTEPTDGAFKPGLDFERNGRRGQALQLEELANGNAGAIKLVAVSIGGNDFGFGAIVRECVESYVWREQPCSQRPTVLERIDAAHVAENTRRIEEGIRAVREAMLRGGYADGTYRLVVQNYMSPLPPAGGLRYGEWEERSDPRLLNGCPLYSVDADWANTRLLPAVNGAVATAVAAAAARYPHILRLDLTNAFVGRRLCEVGVRTIEEAGATEWNFPGAIDRVEWVSKVRVPIAVAPFMQQESLHPNSWGQLALRNCLRRVYVGNRSGSCTIEGPGEQAGREPRMRLT